MNANQTEIIGGPPAECLFYEDRKARRVLIPQTVIPLFQTLKDQAFNRKKLARICLTC